MKTFLRQAVSALLMICLTVGVLPAMSISADAASEGDSILAKINELYDILGNTYFNEKHQGADQCGKKTSGHGCSHCLTGNIVKAKWFIDAFGKISTNQFPTHYLTEKSFATQSAYSCAGFANFAEWYIFKEKSTDKVAVDNIGVYDFDYKTVKEYAKVGDVLRLNNAHSAILVSINEKSVTVLDSNWPGSTYNCMVQKHNISYATYSTCTISRSKTNTSASAAPAPAQTQPSLSSVSITPGVYHIEAYCGKVVEVEDSKTENRANVQLWALSNRDLKCQRFDIQPSGSGYVLKAVHSKKAIDVADGATKSGTNVWQWGLNQTAAQTWTFEDAGNGYVYIKSGFKTYLTVKNNGTANGTNVVSSAFDGGNAQKFRLIPYGAADSAQHGETVSVKAGTYHIEAYCGKIVEVEDSKTASGANVQLWALSSRNLGCQKWQIAASNGGYVVKATHSGRVLDVADGSAKSGTNVWQWGLNQTAAQTWTFEDAGGGYVYIRSGLRTYLTVKNSGTSNGTNVVSCLFDGSSAQRFKLVKV